MIARVMLTGLVAALLAAPAHAAATQAEIDAAIKKGVEYFQVRYEPGARAFAGHGTGPIALAGLAMLECGTKPDHAAVRNIANSIREAAYTETRTYQLSLSLLFLDRLGESADEGLIQMIGVRLLAGQNGNGGWTYICIDDVPAAQERELRTALMNNQLVAGRPAETKPKSTARPQVGGTMIAEVEKYRKNLMLASRARGGLIDDNSNTQFAILAVWVSRRHGVPVEDALALIEKRFLASQNKQTGGWPYSGFIADGGPSMTCAGLIGLATAVGRREEKTATLKASKPTPAPKPATPPTPAPSPKSGGDPFFNPSVKPPTTNTNDPFFNPPAAPVPMPEPKPVPVPKVEPPKVAAPKAKAKSNDPRDHAVEKGMIALGNVLAGAPLQARKGPRGFEIPNVALRRGDRDFYFLWSLERVGVIFGQEKIGAVDWYQYGVESLLPTQNADGAWANGSYGPDIDTAFALLFLARSNLVRDLSARVQKDPLNSELRAGTQPAAIAKGEVKPMIEAPAVEEDPAQLAKELTSVTGTKAAENLRRIRDSKGPAYTQALVLGITQSTSARKAEIREALAERLTRMTADTLREMLRNDEPELRRAAVLACAMKDDKVHIPDLIGRLKDDDLVARAARAGLKSLTNREFASVEAWNSWWEMEKK